MDYNKWFEQEFPSIKLNPPGSILADTAHFLVTYIRKKKPRIILEMGSGVSTAMLGLEVQKYGGELISIEHEKEYIEYTLEICRKANYLKPNVIHAPLVKSTYPNVKDFICYEKSKIPAKSYDFIFIDGPPGFKKNHPGRRGTFYQIFELLSPASCVFLDDGNRKKEQEAMMEWMNIFGSQLSASYHKFEKAGFEIQITK